MAERQHDFRKVEEENIKSQEIEEEFDELYTNINLENFGGSIKTLDFTADNDIIRVEHDLDRIPNGYLVLEQSGDGNLLIASGDDATLISTVDSIWLKATKKGRYKILVI